MEVIVRGDNGDEWDKAEKVQAVNITANNEEDARRLVLERAWCNKLLVSRFLSIHVKQGKPR
jgi:hypothetical protein